MNEPATFVFREVGCAVSVRVEKVGQEDREFVLIVDAMRVRERLQKCLHPGRGCSMRHDGFSHGTEGFVAIHGGAILPREPQLDRQRESALLEAPGHRDGNGLLWQRI